jgi:hypothetical protein
MLTPSGTPTKPTYPPGASRAQRLCYRFIGTDTFEDGVRAHAVRQVFDSRDSLVAALCDDVGGAELKGELLPLLMAAHRDDATRAHARGREHAEQSDGAVADDRDRHPRLHVGGDGGEPSGAHDVGKCEEARQQIVVRHLRCRDECAVGERHANEFGLRAPDRFAALTRALETGTAVRARVVRCEERADHKLATRYRPYLAADFFDDAAILVAERRWLRDSVEPSIAPQI